MELSVGACTRRSHTHAANQDRVSVGEDVLSSTVEVQRATLATPATGAVFDGVGGAPAGEVASELAARTLSAPAPPQDGRSMTAVLARADRLLDGAPSDGAAQSRGRDSNP